MEYIELSSIEVEKKSVELYEKVVKSFNYDLVVFVAKGSYTIGRKMADLNNCPLIEIKATRKANKIKKIISPLLKIIPKKIKILLRSKEFNSNIHESDQQRNIIYNDNIWGRYKNRQRILLVDDSVDTGYTIKQCREKIKDFFSQAEIKIAAFNFFENAVIKGAKTKEKISVTKKGII